MADTKDLLQQIDELPPDRREQLAMRLFGAFPFPLYPFFLKYRGLEFPYVVRTPGVCGGSARLIRTRIPVWLFQQMRQLGFTEAKILESYPTLTASDLVQAWGYAAAHQAEIDKEIEENERY